MKKFSRQYYNVKVYNLIICLVALTLFSFYKLVKLWINENEK